MTVTTVKTRLLIAALAAGVLSSAPCEALTYRFDEVKSKVTKAPGGDDAKAARVAKGDAAEGGDVVRTGFWAQTVVSVPEKKARFEIGSSAKARLEGDEPGVLLVLEKGRLKAIFDALTDGPPTERRVAAPGALLAVRGTRYGLEVGENGEALLAVFEGTVEVIPTVEGRPRVLVHADEFCTFGPKTEPRPHPMRGSGMSESSWGRRVLGGGPGDPGRGGPGGMPGRGPGMGPGPGAPAGPPPQHGKH